MPEFTPKIISSQVRKSAETLFAKRAPRPGELFVLGCSTSAVQGSALGTASNLEIAKAIVHPLHELVESHGMSLAVQCCEHVNRTLVVPRGIVEPRSLTEVNIVPELKAGGGAATAYRHLLADECSVVEDLGRGADYGLDIGGVLIGMHLRRDRIAVPVTFPCGIGMTFVLGAYCRLKWVGGPRTHYLD
ncbi:MAG: TIGR01440 family protein [Planctomycetota bacterium]